MKSTRADVERLLGPSKDDYLATYLLKEGSLIIVYSSGPCRPEQKDGWNVPENVVLNVRFSPKGKRRIGAFKLDSRKFRKITDNHVIGILYYINDEDGITYEVQDGKVDSIEHGPPKKYGHLRCGKPAAEKQ